MTPRILALIAGLALASSAQAFELTSPDIADGQFLSRQQEFDGFGCSGANRSPALVWKDPPSGTQSFAVTVYDPDAPTGSGWWHWVVFNLPAATRNLPSRAGNPGGVLPPSSVQGLTDYGQPGFGGACPPPGDAPHRYRFTVHALKVPHLDLDAHAMPALVGYQINASSLGQATLTARYAR